MIDSMKERVERLRVWGIRMEVHSASHKIGLLLKLLCPPLLTAWQWFVNWREVENISINVANTCKKKKIGQEEKN